MKMISLAMLFLVLSIGSIRAEENPRRLADQSDLFDICNSTYGYSSQRCHTLIKNNFFDMEAVEFCKKLDSRPNSEIVPSCLHYIKNKYYDEKEFNECVSNNSGANVAEKILKCLGERGITLKRYGSYRVDSGDQVANRRALIIMIRDLLKQGNSKDALGMLEKLENFE